MGFHNTLIEPEKGNFQDYKLRSLNASELNQSKLNSDPEATKLSKIPHFSSSTIKFAHKKYGRPKALTLSEVTSIPDDKIEILMENEVHQQRVDQLNTKIILFYKFRNT